VHFVHIQALSTDQPAQPVSIRLWRKAPDKSTTQAGVALGELPQICGGLADIAALGCQLKCTFKVAISQSE